MNKDLYGKHFQIDNEMVEHLSQFSNEEAISSLVKNKKISYSNAKKLKHEIENGRKDQLGGDKFYGWLNRVLGSERNKISTGQDAKLEAGLPNSHIKTHKKDGLNDLNRPTKSHQNYNDDIKINESLKRINEIISKLI